jgi:hypothetical protein
MIASLPHLSAENRYGHFRNLRFHRELLPIPGVKRTARTQWSLYGVMVVIWTSAASLVTPFH